MESVVGVFTSREDGERAVAGLENIGVRPDRITFLTPRASGAEIHSVPTTEAEPPGIGRAIGAVTGMAAGAGGGMQAGALVSRGRTVVIAIAEDEAQAERARQLLTAAGAESIDAARELWWLGLRDAEAAEYTTAGGDFVRDETIYRRGFEAACELSRNGRTYAEVVSELQARCPDVYQHESFRQGFARGRTYVRSREERARAA